MRKKVNGKRVVSRITLFVSAVFLLVVSFNSCQHDEMIMEPEEIGLKSGSISEIVLNYPDEVNAGEDFDITYSSSCGKIMIERGYTAELNEYGVIINKVYTGLTCDTENLMWEAVGEDVFESCVGATITENLAEPGTYVYRAKLNYKAVRESGCLDCGDFKGNRYECFMITVVAGNQNEGTFIDERDGHVYKWVKIGEQIWMAENLAFEIEGGAVYGDVAIYGRWYTGDEAVAACPDGWRLPSNADWDVLINYLNNNGYTCEGSYKIARALAAPEVWLYPWSTQGPGYPDCPANTSGFSALPAGYTVAQSFGKQTFWWSSDVVENPNMAMRWPYGLAYEDAYLEMSDLPSEWSLSVRCIKNAE